MQSIQSEYFNQKSAPFSNSQEGRPTVIRQKENMNEMMGEQYYQGTKSILFYELCQEQEKEAEIKEQIQCLPLDDEQNQPESENTLSQLSSQHQFQADHYQLAEKSRLMPEEQNKQSHPTPLSNLSSKFLFKGESNPSSQAKMNLQQSQLQMASLFVVPGPRENIFKFYASKNIEYPQLFTIMFKVFKAVWPKLKQILSFIHPTKQFKIDLRHGLVKPLINCRLWMGQGDLNCFLSIIRSVFVEEQYDARKDDVIELCNSLFKMDEEVSRKYKRNDKGRRRRRSRSINQLKLYKQSKQQTNSTMGPIHNPTDIVAYKRNIGKMFARDRPISQITKTMARQCPSPSWNEQLIQHTITKLVEEGMQKFIRLTKRYEGNDKKYPRLAATPEDIRGLAEDEKEEDVRKKLVEVVAISPSTHQKFIELMANLVDTVNNIVVSREVQFE